MPPSLKVYSGFLFPNLSHFYPNANATHSLTPCKMKGTIYFPLWLVNGGNALHFVGMKCSSRHTPAPIDSISGGPLPPSLPPGVRLVEAHSLQSERRPITPSSLPRYAHSGPERRPTPSSLSTVCIPLGCRFCFSSHSRGSWG